MILQTSGNRIGGVLAGEPNLISGNTEDGIQITTDAGDDNRVEGNTIGANVLGTLALANLGQGVAILAGADSNVIGGTAAAYRNVISGNGNDGILIADAGTTGNLVQGNRIGTNAAGAGRDPEPARHRDRRLGHAATPSAAQRAPRT